MDGRTLKELIDIFEEDQRNKKDPRDTYALTVKDKLGRWMLAYDEAISNVVFTDTNLNYRNHLDKKCIVGKLDYDHESHHYKYYIEVDLGPEWLCA